MIWADKTALGAFALMILVLGFMFVTSSSPQSTGRYNARIAKYVQDCLPGGATVGDAPAPAVVDESLAAPQPAPLGETRLPSQICNDPSVVAQYQADVLATTPPTKHDLLIAIAKYTAVIVLPLWVVLRIIDVRTISSRSRLARNQYWRSMNRVSSKRRRSRSRSDSES